MSECKIDHSQDDVISKLKSQQSFLPDGIARTIELFLTEERPQQTLNELFHLLKKYDLASREEQERRNDSLMRLLT